MSNVSKRADNNEAVTKVGGDFDYLAEVLGDEAVETGMEEMQEYRIVPRVKIVQAMSANDLKKATGEGYVILSPSNDVIAADDESFKFTPIKPFTEFCKWSDRKDPSSPMIMQRTYDKASEVAACARDPERREEVYGEKGEFKARYVEHICFVGIIYDHEHPLHGTPMILSFEKGEFGTGRRFVSSMAMRKMKGKQIPTWLQVWEFTPGFRDQGDKKWFGLDFAPAEIPVVAQEDLAFMKALFQELNQDIKDDRLRVDRTEEDPVEDLAAAEDM